MIKQAAVNYFQAGMSVIPLGEDKRPKKLENSDKHYAWTKHQKELLSPNGNFDTTYGIGIVCGKISGGIECVDIDSKRELIKGELIKKYKAKVQEYDSGVLKKIVCEQSPSGGFHFIYRCANPMGNVKLASRYATPEELEKDPNQKVYCLLETRGTGGYFAAFPTPGYIMKQGELDKIPIISEEERFALLQAAYDLNQVVETITLPEQKKGKRQSGVKSPFDDFNERGDVLEILQNAGWAIAKQRGKIYLLKRPGFGASDWGASYHSEKRTLYIFTSSTTFDPNKAYGPVSVFGILTNGGKDWSEIARILREKGYGDDKYELGNAEQPNEVMVPKTGFIVEEQDFDKYINQVSDGTLPMGLPTGFPTLDKHFVFKRANFNVFGGHDNVGKTLVLLFLLCKSASLHGWKWLVCSTENSPGFVFKALMEFYIGKPVTKMTYDEKQKANKFVKQHFTIVKNDATYTFIDILDMAEQVYADKKIDGLFIDPYNAVDYDMKLLKALGSHEYHYTVTSRFRNFCNKKDCCIYLNCHAVTEALRKVWPKDGCPDKRLVGHPMPPKKADVEGGGKFANRADDFVIIHRYTQCEELYRTTEFHVVKVKETETGGRVTNLNNPVKLEMSAGNCGFIDLETGVDSTTGKKPDLPKRLFDSKSEKEEDPDYEPAPF